MNEAQAKRERAKRNPDNLYLREGVWWIRYNVNGRKIRRSLGTRSLREAKRLCAEILAKRSAAVKFGIEAPVPRKERTFEEIVELWTQSRRADGGLREATLRSTEQHARIWLLPEFRHKLMSEIIVEDVERFLAHLRATHSKRTKKPLTRASIAAIFRSLKTIYRQAIKRRWYAGPNPLDQLDRHPTQGPGRKVCLTEDEARQVLAQLSGATRHIETYHKAALALATGLRWGEVHGLAWTDIQLDDSKPTLTVRRSWQGEPKTAASMATLPLSEEAAALLRCWRAEQGPGAVYLFPDRRGQLRKRSRRQDELRIQRAAEHAGIEKHVTPHVFRHSFGTWLYAKTGDPKIVQRLMRHSSFHTSMGYVHDDRELTDIVNQLPKLSTGLLKAV